MTLSEFLELNGMDKNAKIQIGQKLKVAQAAQKPSEKVIHTVKSGESLWSIAQKYSVSLDDLVYWNGYSSKNISLHPGNKVTVLSETGKTKDGDQIQTSTPVLADNKTQKITYMVKKGDTYSKIAQQHGTTVDKLKEWNKKTSNKLNVGDKLVIYTTAKSTPASASTGTLGSSTSGNLVIHKVQSGDTLYSIAKKYNTTTEEIIRQNAISDPSKLKVGDQIKVLVSN
jgi:LysM repeat protein